MPFVVKVTLVTKNCIFQWLHSRPTENLIVDNLRILRHGASWVWKM